MADSFLCLSKRGPRSPHLFSWMNHIGNRTTADGFKSVVWAFVLCCSLAVLCTVLFSDPCCAVLPRIRNKTTEKPPYKLRAVCTGERTHTLSRLNIIPNQSVLYYRRSTQVVLTGLVLRERTRQLFTIRDENNIVLDFWFVANSFFLFSFHFQLCYWVIIFEIEIKTKNEKSKMK